MFPSASDSPAFWSYVSFEETGWFKELKNIWLQTGFFALGVSGPATATVIGKNPQLCVEVKNV